MISLKKTIGPTFSFIGRATSIIARGTSSLLTETPTFKLTRRVARFLGKKLRLSRAQKKALVEGVGVVFCSCVYYPPEGNSSERSVSQYLYDNRVKILAYTLGAVGLSVSIYLLSVKVQRAYFLQAVGSLYHTHYPMATYKVAETGFTKWLGVGEVMQYAHFVGENTKPWTPEFVQAGKLLLASFNRTHGTPFPFVGNQPTIITAKQMDSLLLFIATSGYQGY